MPAGVKVVGWLVLIAGASAIYDIAAGIIRGGVNVNLAAVLFPVGWGVLRRSNLCREMAIGFGWFMVFALAVGTGVMVLFTLWPPEASTVTFHVLGQESTDTAAVGAGFLLTLGIGGLIYLMIRVLKSPAAVAAFRPPE